MSSRESPWRRCQVEFLKGHPPIKLTMCTDDSANFGEFLPLPNPKVRVEGRGGGPKDARKKEERIASIKVLTAGQGGEQKEFQCAPEEGDMETETEEEEEEEETQGKKQSGEGGVALSASGDKSDPRQPSMRRAAVPLRSGTRTSQA